MAKVALIMLETIKITFIFYILCLLILQVRALLADRKNSPWAIFLYWQIWESRYAANASHKIVLHITENGYVLLYVLDNMWFMFIYYHDLFKEYIWN